MNKVREVFAAVGCYVTANFYRLFLEFFSMPRLLEIEDSCRVAVPELVVWIDGTIVELHAR
jgi:hypothetical protein